MKKRKMNYLWKFSSGRLLVLLMLLSAEVLSGNWCSAARQDRRDKMISKQQILERYRGLSNVEQARSRTLAASRLESNLIPVLDSVARSDNKEIPPNVKLAASSVLVTLKDGKLTQPLEKALPTIMINNPKGNTDEQLEGVLRAVTPNVSRGARAPLESLTKFLSSTVSGTNKLLTSLVSGTPDLLKGVVPALLQPLGALNESLLGTVDSLGELLGGLLG